MTRDPRPLLAAWVGCLAEVKATHPANCHVMLPLYTVLRLRNKTCLPDCRARVLSLSLFLSPCLVHNDQGHQAARQQHHLNNAHAHIIFLENNYNEKCLTAGHTSKYSHVLVRFSKSFKDQTVPTHALTWKRMRASVIYRPWAGIAMSHVATFRHSYVMIMRVGMSSSVLLLSVTCVGWEKLHFDSKRRQSVRIIPGVRE